MHLGVDYYPEHWAEERWEGDLALMKEAGFDTVRILEFAWSRLEPAEGDYRFDWLDRFVELASRYDLSIMMGLPVRNSPPWLLRRDPSAAIVNAEGRRESFGTRYTTCINNPTLRSAAFALTRRLVERYAPSKGITSWHLDNELGDASPCYCDTCRTHFVEWLKARYGSTDSLNSAWGTAFWSLEIADWEEVWLPAATNHFPHNPGLLLDFRRFTSAMTERLAHEQAEIVRSIAPRATVTTNLQSTTRYHTDYFKLSGALDVVSTNFYPPVSYNTIDLDLMRSLKHRGFWVVEQKSSAPDAKERPGALVRAHAGRLAPRPGETRLWSFESLAHGADMILYFRFRACPYGAEQFHGGILGHDGKPGRIYEEIRSFGSELRAIEAAIGNEARRSEIALLYSYDSRWALADFPLFSDLDERRSLLDWHGELEAGHYPCDVLSPEGGLDGYRLLVAPLLYLMSDEIARRLLAFAESGGTLILTAGSGAKDANAGMAPGGLPADLQKAMGVRVEELFALAPAARALIESADGAQYECAAGVALLEAAGARVVARYASGWYAGRPAVTESSVGKGRIYYLGTFPDEPFRQRLLAEALRQAGVEPLLRGSRNLHVLSRGKGDRRILFVLNPSERAGSVELPQEHTELLTGRRVRGRLELAPLEVAVLQRG